MGFGDTVRPEGLEFTPQTWVEHIIGLLDALDVTRCAVVGNSFGGSLALRISLQRPDLIERQVLMGPAGTSFPVTSELDAAWGYTASTPARMRAQLEDFVHDSSLVTEQLVHDRHAAATAPGVLEQYAQMFPPPRQRWVDALALTDEQLGSVTQETLIVHGREDRIVRLESSEKLVRLIPNAQLHVFGGCGHWVQIEQGPRFVRLVGSFLAEGVW
jgi:2-hydroxymuconate-semialdehyde hydrolase